MEKMTPLREYIKNEMLKSNLPKVFIDRNLENCVKVDSLNENELRRIFEAFPQRLKLNVINFDNPKAIYECIDVYRYIFLNDIPGLAIALASDFYNYSDSLVKSEKKGLDISYPVLGFVCRSENFAREMKNVLIRGEYSSLDDEHADRNPEQKILIIGKKREVSEYRR